MPIADFVGWWTSFPVGTPIIIEVQSSPCTSPFSGRTFVRGRLGSMILPISRWESENRSAYDFEGLMTTSINWFVLPSWRGSMRIAWSPGWRVLLYWGHTQDTDLLDLLAEQPPPEIERDYCKADQVTLLLSCSHWTRFREEASMVSTPRYIELSHSFQGQMYILLSLSNLDFKDGSMVGDRLYCPSCSAPQCERFRKHLKTKMINNI